MNSRRFSGRAKRDQELRQEIAFHIQEEIAENIERGIQLDEAKRRAYLKFGNPQRVREESWRQGSLIVVETLARDVRHAIRRLAKSPTTVLTVAISLGLGIAANLFIFTAVNKLVLQGPPVGDPATLLNLYPTTHHGQSYGRFTQQCLTICVGKRPLFWPGGIRSSIARDDRRRERARAAWGQHVTATP